MSTDVVSHTGSLKWGGSRGAGPGNCSILWGGLWAGAGQVGRGVAWMEPVGAVVSSAKLSGQPQPALALTSLLPTPGKCG